MKVKALALGFIGGRRIRPGDVFEFNVPKGGSLPAWLAPVEPKGVASKPSPVQAVETQPAPESGDNLV